MSKYFRFSIIVLIIYLLSIFTYTTYAVNVSSSVSSYNNENINSTNIQDAIDEVYFKIQDENNNLQPFLYQISGFHRGGTTNASGRGYFYFKNNVATRVRWSSANVTALDCSKDGTTYTTVTNGTTKDTWHDLVDCPYIRMYIVISTANSGAQIDDIE